MSYTRRVSGREVGLGVSKATWVSTATRQAPGIHPLRTVHNSVYSAQAYELELERILRRVWVFVCHESEIAEVGQFITRVVAGDPILVVRSRADVIQAFHNVCRHRGSQVAPDPAGRAKAFQCPYHHWTYGLDGHLMAVPGEAAYEGTGFDRASFGLLPARAESVYGLVFVCLSDEAPPLRDYLGSQLLDVVQPQLGSTPYEVFHFDSWVLKANWKLFGENARDGYHVPFVHESFLGRASPPQPYRLLENNHAVQAISLAREAVDEETWSRTTEFPLPDFEPGQGWLVNIFPDLVVTARTSVVEILSQLPLSHDETLYEVRALGLVGDSQQQRQSRRLAFETWLRTQQAEDRAAMENQQRGLVSRSMRTSIIARGPDATTGQRGDDNRLRQFWSGWRQMMGMGQNSLPPYSS